MGNGPSLRRAIQDERWGDVRNILGSEEAWDRVRNKRYTVKEESVTALHLVCCHRGAPLDIVGMMLENAPRTVSAKTDPGGHLPLHYAIKKRRQPLDMINLLVVAHPEGVAERSAPETGGQTPLHIACASKASVDVVQMLSDANHAARHVQDGSGCSPWEVTRANTWFWNYRYRKAVRDILQGEVREENVQAVHANNEEEAREETDSSGDTDIDRGAKGGYGLCVLCWDGTADRALIPCGHLCLCSECSSNKNLRRLNWKCPVCTRRFEGANRIFLSGIQDPTSRASSSH